MRSLTVEEIERLEHNGCTAADWGNILVAEDFRPDYIRDVAFYGEVRLGVFEKTLEVTEGLHLHSGIRQATLCDVTIGDNCLIEHISGYICRYTIGEECYIAGVGQISTFTGSSFGQGHLISVLNEAGEGNIVLYDGLSSQMAAWMLRASADPTLWPQVSNMAMDFALRNLPEQGTIGDRVKLVNTQEVVNTLVGDECEISGALQLCDCTLASTPEAACFVGNGVVCENTIISAGASVVGGARLDNCYVGEACHIGKGFSAESSVFFANSHLDNGEACAAFCGPFTVSHHKASLLIGSQYAFYNAGSATNFSNHAYKLGPVHYGVMERGSKTASGAHLLLPAHVGCFSVCIGKIQQHPDTRLLPFSYLIGEGNATYIVPGRNLLTVGTYRDVGKWPKRDKRPQHDRYALGSFEGAFRSIINFDWLNPMVAAEVAGGLQLLKRLQAEQGPDQPVYHYGNCLIKASSLAKGILHYELAMRLYVGKVAKDRMGELPESTIGTGEWTDLAGLLAPASEIEAIADGIRQGELTEVADIENRFADIHRCYDSYQWNSAYRLLLDYLGVDMLTADDLDRIAADYEKARHEWLAAIRHDAEREFDLGDVEEKDLAAFIRQLEKDSVSRP